ncbi:hypothetical protein Mal64_04500 [Pseudobythopirellula maris]|uniref:Uncharacterized protein n=1 Tax=Pseudobythopirellula maris TaxID=2527991 RepID=A0A5C5ZSU8_9BACT|nr:hypothetical protein Mal64_04500 [Pseudobythopirellula maris]
MTEDFRLSKTPNQNGYVLMPRLALGSTGSFSIIFGKATTLLVFQQRAGGHQPWITREGQIGEK